MVHRLVRQPQRIRFAGGALLDPVDRQGGQFVGDVTGPIRHDAVDQQRAVDVRALALLGGERDETVHSPQVRQLSGHVPFADERAVVARGHERFEEGGRGRIPRRQVVLYAMAAGVLARQERAPRRTAQRGRDERIGGDGPLGRQPVQVGRLQEVRVVRVEPDMVPAMVVADDHHQVRVVAAVPAVRLDRHGDGMTARLSRLRGAPRQPGRARDPDHARQERPS